MEESLFAQIDLAGLEEPLFLEKIRAFEEPVFLEVGFKGIKDKLQVRTQPIKR